MMSRTILITLFAALMLCSGAVGADLYRVAVQSGTDAALLAKAEVEALVRIQDGYLVLADGEGLERLDKYGLTAQFLASDLTAEEIAVDGRLDRANVGSLPLLFEEDNLRVYRVDVHELETMPSPPQVFPVTPLKPTIDFAKPEPVDVAAMRTKAMADLDSLIAQVNKDSLTSYVETMQAFGVRLCGSAVYNQARDWYADQLTSFGYDSVVIDQFTSGNTYHNVYAVKVGSRFPDHQIVIGSHLDAVSSSPGADDNGSGSAAVLEIARILKDVETDMTFVFATFDAEEIGLVGSNNYADRALANGDNIVLMFNMDMIAHYENTNQAKLYHGTDVQYANIWQDLADSLVGITGNLMGSTSGSDHYPFQQNGYSVVFLHEQIFSTVYHSYQDSTTYMDFDYMTEMVKASLATVYYVNSTQGPRPSLEFEYPGGLPTALTPDVPNTFEVVVSALYEGTPVSGSGELHYAIDGGAYTSVAMTETSANHYDATLPALSCGQYLHYYVTAEELDEGEFRDPVDAQLAFPATDVVTVFEDDFDTDKGWTPEGSWARGTPTGGGGDHGSPDPTSGHSGTSVFGYNLSGDYGANMDETHLTSPSLNCTGLFNVTLDFWRWLGVEQPSYDHAYIRISNDGTSWNTIWENTEEVADGAWSEHTFDISEYADNQANVYVRYTMGETDGSWFYCGWNIDDVAITGYGCDLSPDSDSDGFPDATDNCPYFFNPLQEDTDEDGVGDACCCAGPSVGNVDGSADNLVTMGDLTVMIDALFISLVPIGCPSEGNIDQSVDGLITMGDLTVLIDALFISLDPLPGCP